jgi:signal transduction histidine kinase
MGERLAFRWQIILVMVLFVAALATLLSSSLAALWLPSRQDAIRADLSDASRRMAEEAAPLLREPAVESGKEPPPDWHHRLSEISARVLADLPAEGGFFLAGERSEFTGYAFPNDPHAPPEPVEADKRLPLPGKKHKHPPLPPPPRRDPPPRERDVILAQIQASLALDANEPPSVQTLEVGLSRVMIVTQPVGGKRPARLATWVMMRLTGPESLAANLRRYQTATGLALAGILMALVLTIGLGRNLRRERQQREQLREELRRSEHLAALGKLLAGVAHEVRNPLAAIRSTAQLYQRLPPQSRDPAVLDAILHGVDRLNSLVSRLLFFVRSGHEERRPVDVNAIVQETLTLLRAQADSQHVVLRTELASDVPTVSASGQALQQVVLNLAANALQAMPNGGTLLCRTLRLDGPPRIELWIADTGPGIAAAELPHLFEPFHTTRPEGTGLGLALCREIVQQHGGRIELERETGWGAVFRVTLPLEPV